MLYTACSSTVALGLARDRFATGLIDPEDLMPGDQPELAEIQWSGVVVDVASTAGVAAAGFVPSYSSGVDHAIAQQTGLSWHGARHEGVLCRSASLARLGMTAWSGPCTAYAETATFTEVCTVNPEQVNRRRFADWY